MKTSFAVQVMAAVVFCLNTLPAADHVVTVEAGSTNTVDATFVTALGSAERLVKRGAGALVSSAALAGYAGEIVVEEGVLIAPETGSVGTTAGKTVVSNGATIVFALATANCAKFGNEVFCISGDGAPGEEGALVVSRSSLTGSGGFRYLTLLGDARIRATGEFTIYAGKIDMNGHTLKLSIRDKSPTGSTSWEYIMAFNRSRVVNPGHIIVESGRFSINGRTLSDGTAIWDGDNSNTLTVKTRGRLQLAQSLTEIPWKIVLEKSTGLMFAGDADASNPMNNAFLGDLELTEGYIPFSYRDAQKGNANMHGCVYGDGGMSWSGYTTMHFWNTNSYLGGTSVSAVSGNNAPLQLHCGRALPLNGGEAKLVDSNLPLLGDDFYELPVLSFTNTTAVSAGEAAVRGGTVAGLKKTGTGVLTLSARLSVTGLTELVQGSIKLPSPQVAAAGLVHTWTNGVNDSDTGNYWYKVGSNTEWPSAVKYHRRSPHIAYLGPQPFHTTHPAVTVYDGYIWNNSDEEKTWSFVSATESRAKLWINGVEQISQISYQYARFKKVTLQPGANRFRYGVCLFRASQCAARSPEIFFGFDGKQCDPVDPAVVSWTNYIGFAVNRDGTDSMLYTDYEKAVDPGDGTLFTVASNLTEMAACRPSFRDFVCHEGTVFDLNARSCTVTIPRFSGEGTVKNGVLEIGERLTVRADRVASAPLGFVDADLRFAEGAVVSVDDITALSKERVKDNPYVIAVTDGSFTAAPSPDAELEEGRWKIELSGDSRSMLMYYVKRGISVMIR